MKAMPITSGSARRCSPGSTFAPGLTRPTALEELTAHIHDFLDACVKNEPKVREQYLRGAMSAERGFQWYSTLQAQTADCFSATTTHPEAMK